MEKVHGFLVITLLQVVDHSLWSLTNNHKNNFLVLGERSSAYINDSVCVPEKKIGIKFTNTKTKLCVYIIMVIYFLTEKIYKFRAHNKNVNFWVGSMSENLDYVK